MDNNRQIIFKVLNKILSNDSYSTIVLDTALENVENKADRAFITRVVYGVVEKKITLEYIIEKSLDKPYNKVKPKLKTLLLMGVYQLYFCDKIPSHAALNETIEVAVNNSLEFYKGFLNAVLRKCDKNRIDFDNVDLSVKYSVPSHLINMWKKQYGNENLIKILNSLENPAPLFATANSLFLNNEELIYELKCEDVDAEIFNETVMITSQVNLTKLKSFENGLFHIQDYSSKECALSLNVKENEVVLDICSAPGGKSFTIAEQMKNTGKVYAFDLYENRLNLIKDGAKRLGILNIETFQNDATNFNENIEKADKILCDVPCSGFGIIRRKPEIRYKNLDSIKELPEIQFTILSTSSMYLKEKGTIVYSTCTLNKKENEKVVEKFLSLNNNFKLIYQKTNFPENNGADGFYHAVIEKV